MLEDRSQSSAVAALFINISRFYPKKIFLEKGLLSNLIYNMARIIKFEKYDCAPCAQVSAYLDNKGISYETINPFDEPELAVKFKVRTVPTVIVLDGEEIKHRIIGFKPEELEVAVTQ